MVNLAVLTAVGLRTGYAKALLENIPKVVMMFRILHLVGVLVKILLA